MKKSFTAIKPTPDETTEIARIATQLVEQVRIDILNKKDASIEDDDSSGRCSSKGNRQ